MKPYLSGHALSGGGLSPTQSIRVVLNSWQQDLEPTLPATTTWYCWFVTITNVTATTDLEHVVSVSKLAAQLFTFVPY